jgi:integrase
MQLVGRPKLAKPLPKALPRSAVEALLDTIAPDRESKRQTDWAERDLALILTALLGGATAGFDRPDTGDEERICNLAPRIPAARRFTRIYRGRKELIDDNFVSHALVGKSRRITSSPTQWVPFHPATTTPRKRRGAPESDRRLVLATIDL